MLESVAWGSAENYPQLLEHLRTVLVVQPKAEEIAVARRQAETAASQAPRREDRVRFCHILSQHYVNYGETDTALKWIDEARRLSAGLPRLEALTAHYHATVLHRARRSAEALKVIEPYLDINPEDDLSLASRLATVRAGILDSMGRVDEAETWYRTAFDLRKKVGDPSGLAIVYYNYAEFCKRRDDEEMALEYFLKAYNIDVTLDNPAGLAQTACQIALVYARHGDRKEAKHWIELATKSAEAGGIPIVIAFVKVNKAAMYDVLEDESNERATLKDALEYTKKYSFESFFANIQGELGKIYVNEGKYDEAEPLLEYALTIARKEEQVVYIGSNLYQIGRLRAAQGRFDEAKKALTEAAKLLKSVVHHKYAVRALRELSKVHASLGETTEAFDTFSKLFDEHLNDYEENIRKRITRVKLNYERQISEQESDKYRQKTIELSDALRKLEKANKDLRELATDKDEFMAIAAHDLRNPLADMRSMLQTMISHFDVLGKEDILDICRDLLTATTRMSATIHSFLEISRTDKRSSGLSINRIDLVHLIHLAIERHHLRAEEKGMTINVGTPGQIWATGDASIVAAVLDNLISNAIKYSPHDTEIGIKTGTDSTSSFITVCDEGPGIPEIDRDKLFTKYSRMSIRPTGGEDSLGIGLYLAKRMAERMKAKIEYKYENGSCFTLRMERG